MSDTTITASPALSDTDRMEWLARTCEFNSLFRETHWHTLKTILVSSKSATPTTDDLRQAIDDCIRGVE